MQLTNTNDLAINGVKAMIIGESGSGKTTLAKTLDHERTLVLDLESGMLPLKGTNISAVRIKCKADLDEVLKNLTNGWGNKFDNIFLDSYTELGEMMIKEIKKDPKFKDPKMGIKMWGVYNETMQMYTKYLRDLSNFNVFLTCLPSTKTDGIVQIETIAIPGQAIKDSVRAWFDLVLVLKAGKDDDKKSYRHLITSAEEHPLAKDRSGSLKPFEKPHLQDIITKVNN